MGTAMPAPPPPPQELGQNIVPSFRARDSSYVYMSGSSRVCVYLGPFLELTPILCLFSPALLS